MDTLRSMGMSDDYELAIKHGSNMILLGTIIFGARGNSGVITSQFFKGISECFYDVSEVSPLSFVEALQNGVEKAYKSVSNPVEGTILTVIREATENVYNEVNNDNIQDFEELIQKNYFYIDKTEFIKEWWEAGDSTTLITRPRRFGKTLNISMLEQFFSLSYEGRGDLFEGLSIWQEEKYRQLQGTYPVISLSFANVKKAVKSFRGGNHYFGKIWHLLWLYRRRSIQCTGRVWIVRRKG